MTKTSLVKGTAVLAAAGLFEMCIRDSRTIINYYTRESGVRNLEREIGNLCRKVAKSYVCGDTKKVSMSGKKVQELLGKKKFHFDIIKGETEVGVTTGLAWTAVGGDTLFIETVAVPGTRCV